MTGLLFLLASTPIVLADAPPPRLHGWHMQKPISAGNIVDVTIVRGQIRRVISKDASHIGVSVKMDRPASVDIEIKPTADGWVVRDIYPSAPVADFRECVPPAGSRGAFWLSDVVLDVTIFAPPSVVVRTHGMDPVMFGEKRP